MYNRNNVKTASAYVPSVASDASVINPCFMAPAPCEITGIRFITGGATLSTDWNLNVYKNASDSASRLSTSLAASQAASSSFVGMALTVVSTVALRRMATGDEIFYELTLHGGTSTNSRIEIDYIYGYTNA